MSIDEREEFLSARREVDIEFLEKSGDWIRSSTSKCFCEEDKDAWAAWQVRAEIATKREDELLAEIKRLKSREPIKYESTLAPEDRQIKAGVMEQKIIQDKFLVGSKV